MKWPDDADRISDQIVKMMNEEIAKVGFNPVIAHAGLCLGLMAYMRSAPRGMLPMSFLKLEGALVDCLKDIRVWVKEKEKVQ